jgi:hypothetical protein
VYLDEINEKKTYNTLHAFLAVEHFLRQGPPIGNFLLVPGGGSYPRLWEVDAIDKRHAVQMAYLRAFNDWPEKPGQIPITTFITARQLMETCLFPKKVYPNVAARLLGPGSNVMGEVPPCNAFEQDLVDVIVKHSTADPKQPRMM